MNFHEALELAKSGTEIYKARKNILYTFGPTRLPYICLSQDSSGGICVREGEVTADRPAIAIPGDNWKFEGFEAEGVDGEGMIPVLVARGIHFPPLNYTNKHQPMRTVYREMKELVDEELNRLDAASDLRTGVFRAPNDLWQISLLIYVGAQVARSAPANIAEHIERRRLQS